MQPFNSTSENDCREQTRLDCWSSSHLSSALNTASDAAAGRTWAPLKCFLPCILLNFPFTLIHTTRRVAQDLLIEFRYRMITHKHFVTSAAAPTTLPPPPKQRSMECSLSLRVVNDKQTVSQTDMCRRTEDGWGTEVRGDDTDEGEADSQAGEHVSIRTSGWTLFSVCFLLFLTKCSSAALCLIVYVSSRTVDLQTSIWF